MSKKTKDLAGVIQMDPPDLKRLQLLLQGSISTQVCVRVRVRVC